jgi:ubiquinone/menaquinone biosynthesis C-methylase UbiE
MRERPQSKPPSSAPVNRPTDWGEVAQWYDQVQNAQGSDFHREVIFPKMLKLLGLTEQSRLIDIASGQGAWCRLVAPKIAKVVGVELADELLKLAKKYPVEGKPVRYVRADAREFSQPLVKLEPGVKFDRATCVLAIQNISPIGPVFAELAKVLEAGGVFVMVMMHPCFRGAKESHWGFDEQANTQYRRVDRYLMPRKHPIVAHPGKADLTYTWTFHRPIEAYVRELAKHGFMVSALEEWASHKESQPGKRAAAENRARDEIPMFMAIRAVKTA